MITAKSKPSGQVIYSNIPDDINTVQFCDIAINAIERELLRLHVEKIYFEDVFISASKELDLL